MKWCFLLTSVLVCAMLPSVAFAQQHFALSDAWTTGIGHYVIVQDGDDNRVMVASALNNNDPKHAWVAQDFGNSFTVRCDIRMESWVDGEDLSRAGIAALIKPNPAPDGDGDRGVNLLFHQDLDNVEYLNDLVAWANTNDNQFPWELQTWYTFELSIVDGSVAEGQVYLREDGPGNAFMLDSWEFPNPADREGGFPGVTASTLGGLMASFDNFQVLVDGQVVFGDDFEGTDPISNVAGLSNSWVGGLGGFYIVDNGQLFALATGGLDPKHAWVNQELVGGGSINADVTIVSWQDEEDLSRAGLALHVQPNPAPDGDGDRGLNLLFHDNVETVEYLNDLVAWADTNDGEFPWTVGTTYRFEFTSDGTTVNGTVTNTEDTSDFITLDSWEFPGTANRQDGFAGITASTLRGLIAAYDNVEILDANGNVVFTDDFEEFVTSSSENWNLYR